MNDELFSDLIIRRKTRFWCVWLPIHNIFRPLLYLPVAWFTIFLIAGPEQSIKIDDRKTNRSIDDNQLIIVNWHRLASANRWSIDNHTEVVANFIDCHRLALNSCLRIFRYRASARRSYIIFKPQLQSLRIVHRCGSAKTAQIIKTINISRCQ